MELTNKIEKTSTFNKAVLNKYLHKIVYYLLATILLFTGITKIIDLLPMIETMKQIKVLPESLQILTATILPIIEMTLGLFMLLTIKPKVTLTTVTILFAIFLGFSIYGTLIGVESDCGCFGNTVKSEFGIEMIVRNFIFVILSLYISFINKSLQGKNK